jgi:uncharacterized protein YfdQ (DUF2303 family)
MSYDRMSPQPPSTIFNADGDTSAAVRAGELIANASERVVEISGIPVAITAKDMSVTVLTAALDQAEARKPAPSRRKGTATHLEVESFIEHVNRFKDEGSAIFADTQSVRLNAVFDYHKADAPRWGQHRAVYTCPLSRQWQLWIAANEKEMSQDTFADFIDANLKDLASRRGNEISDDIAQPAAVVEMARNLSVRSNVVFERKVDPTTGASSLVSKDERDASSTKIPRAFLLGIPVFEGGAAYQIEARLRLKMQGGRPTFSFALYQTDVILRDAFGEVRTKVKDATALPVFAGSPE